MQTWEWIVLGIMAVIGGLIGVALTASVVWVGISASKLLKAINELQKTAPDFIKSINGLAEAAEQIKQGNKANEGHIKLGHSFLLEYAKLRVTVERFARLVTQPQQEQENAKHGFQMPTDADADKEAYIRTLVEGGGYSREEAEQMAQASIGA